MLYISTRNKSDSYTAHRALHEDRTPDGGLFMPMQVPSFDKQQIVAMKSDSFFDNVARILNLFFPVRISAWDVKVCFGRSPANLVPIGHKITVAEIWHVLDSSYEKVVQRLYDKLTVVDRPEPRPTNWAKVAIRIATLFGIFAKLDQPGYQLTDIVVTTDDFSTPMAAWYAKQMGLPVGTILCACNENGAVWDLMHRGVLNTGSSIIHTQTPDLDTSVPSGLERLIACITNRAEMDAFVSSLRKHTVFQIGEEAFQELKAAFDACVVGSRRISNVISNVFKTSKYVMDPYAAICYGCLQDYRATSGERRDTVLLADRSPLLYIQSVAEATGLKQENLENMIRQP